MAQELRKAKFRIDDGDIIEGWTRGERWNGWAMPCFSDEQLPALLKSFNVEGVMTLKQSECYNYVVTIFHDSDITEVIEYDSSSCIRLWPIGAGSWCWDEVTEEEVTK